MPSLRREMAKETVTDKALSIRLASLTLGIIEICYRYQAMLSDEGTEIADWLVRIKLNQRNWGFGLCFFVTADTSKDSAGSTSACNAFTRSWS